MISLGIAYACGLATLPVLAAVAGLSRVVRGAREYVAQQSALEDARRRVAAWRGGMRG